MKMVKAILLGSATAMVSTFASAADLPRKAAPAEYVQVCQGQGAGFFVVPGTTTCLQIGGFIRADYFAASSSSNSAAVNGQNAYAMSSSLFFHLDARTQTSMGTLRSYGRAFAMRGGLNLSDPSGLTTTSFNTLEAFIQFAGITAGFLQSQYDFYKADYTYISNMVGATNTRNNQLAYTASFGGGLSATISLEEAAGRRAAVTVTPLVPAGIPAADSAMTYGANRMPDVVANINYKSAMIEAQVMGAYHDVRNNYGANTAGYAFGAGVKYKVTTATELLLQAGISNGANAYTTVAPRYAMLGNTPAGLTAVNADAYYNGANYVTTKAMSIIGGVNHIWSPSFRTALVGGYQVIDAPTAVTSTSTVPLVDTKHLNIALNNTWTPVAGLGIGLELVYEQVGFNTNGSSVTAPATYKNLGAHFRINRSF